MYQEYDSSDSGSDDSSDIIINDLNASESGTDNEFDSESDYDSDNDSVDFDDFDQIYQEDSYHVYNERQHDHYYIGLAKRISYNSIIMVNSVSPMIFFKFPFLKIRDYLAKYSIILIKKAKVHIMKLCILSDETYSVIIKTFWLSIVQRHWKKVFQMRKKIISMRKQPMNLQFKEIHGKYRSGLNYIPSLYGMLACYSMKRHQI